ncbi:MAG: transglutaminase-like domain-containing protein [Planctomycetota bacterium]|jgi:hypothetical protein
MSRLFFLNRLNWPLRLPIKCALFALALLVVCFPYPDRLFSHIRHWRDPNALIEPGALALHPLIEELESKLNADLSAKDTLGAIQNYVYKKIPYEWDWKTWGNADYLPTVTEAVEMGREDCDGRAVVAASLLSHFGFDAEIVTDFAHVWVKTEHGETMGPGKKKAVIATDEGLKVQRDALAQLPRALAYSIAPFPLPRELILVFVAWLLMLRPHGGVYCNVVALVLLLAGLLFLRAGGKDHLNPVLWQQFVGVANMLAALAALLVWARQNAGIAAQAATGGGSSPAPSGETGV